MAAQALGGALAAPRKPGGAACATCPGRDAPCALPQPAGASVRLAVVGDYPTRGEAAEGRAWSGGGVRLLGRGLASIGLQRHEVHWSNAVLCDVAPKDVPKAAKLCAPRLLSELQAVGAPLLMPTGSHALQRIMGLAKRPNLQRWRGSVSHAPTTLGGPHALVLPTLDPVMVSRAERWKPLLEIDVARLGRVLAGGFTPPEAQEGRSIVVARTRETLTALLARLGPEVAFDVETVGLGPTHTALVCFVLSDGHTTMVVPWSRGLNGLESWWGVGEADVAHEVSEALATRVTVTHNGPAFDHIVAARYGIRIARWDDTLLAAHATQSHLPKNLAQVVSQHLDVGPWKQWDHNGSVDAMWQYCGLDGLYTILTWFAMRERVRA